MRASHVGIDFVVMFSGADVSVGAAGGVDPGFLPGKQLEAGSGFGGVVGRTPRDLGTRWAEAPHGGGEAAEMPPQRRGSETPRLVEHQVDPSPESTPEARAVGGPIPEYGMMNANST